MISIDKDAQLSFIPRSLLALRPLVLASVLVATVSGAPPTTSQPSTARRGKIIESYGKLPLSFEANLGQADNQVKFLSRGSGYTLFLTNQEAVFSFRKGGNKSVKPGQQPSVESNEQTVLRLKVLGGNPNAEVTGVDQLPGTSNYFIGNDADQWRSKVTNYSKVHYSQVYSGVDLVYYGNQRQLEYDFVVAPGADPNSIRLQFSGAGKANIDGQGDLVLGAKGEGQFLARS